MTDEAMSPLRRRMIEDMTVRKFVEKTMPIPGRGRYPRPPASDACAQRAMRVACLSWHVAASDDPVGS